jgi:hypothetical protein
MSTAPVRTADRADLLAELEAAAATLTGWAERLAATPGHARFLLTDLDNAAASAGRALAAARSVYRDE